jgi:hypothetical protein
VLKPAGESGTPAGGRGVAGARGAGHTRDNLFIPGTEHIITLDELQHGQATRDGGGR